MFLDKLKLRSMVFQVQYAPAFEMWDSSGAVARRMTDTWPGLTVTTGEPNRVILKAPGITVRSELTTGILLITGISTLDATVSRQIRESVDCWRELLKVEEFTRVSMLVEYSKEYQDLALANEALLAQGLVRWPTEKVFDQSIQGKRNGVDVSYRFEDENTFSVLRARTEGLLLEQHNDPEFFDELITKVEKNRLLVSFDRGILKPINAQEFHTEEWLKGYFHVLRRDVGKILE